MSSRFTVALTGGIGSGKTAVSNRLAELGADIVDTDCIARELVQPGSAVLTAIAEHFGPDMVNGSGHLDRPRLRQRIFADAGAKSWLDALMHPAIRRRMWEALEAGSGPYGVAVIPILAEGGQTAGIDRILVVDAPEERQIERVMARDGVLREQAEAALRAQASRTRRLALADDVLMNDGGLEPLHKAVDALHARYLNLAAIKAAQNGAGTLQ